MQVIGERKSLLAMLICDGISDSVYCDRRENQVVAVRVNLITT